MNEQIIEIDEDGKVIVHMAACCRAAVQAEREACAEKAYAEIKVRTISSNDALGAVVAQAIRARTAQEEGK